MGPLVYGQQQSRAATARECIMGLRATQRDEDVWRAGFSPREASASLPWGRR